MPARRTSPRRSATRPSLVPGAPGRPWTNEAGEPVGGSGLATAAPWLALLALVLAAATIGFLLIRGGDDLGACRTAAWSAIPDAHDLPDEWHLGSTDLNANGITVSVMKADPGDGTSPPVVVASVTCYGSNAANAVSAARDAAKAVGSDVGNRPGGVDAIDIHSSSTGSTTSMFRTGSLVAQIADSGEASSTDLDKIATSVARAMGDEHAAGTSAKIPDSGATGSDEPTDSGDLESTPPFAPELEAALPRSIADPGPDASPGATVALGVISASASDAMQDATDPGSRSLVGWLTSVGKTTDDLEYAASGDESGTLDLAIRGFRLPGVDGAKLRDAIVERYLSSTAPGVTTKEAKISGKTVTTIDYGDGQALEYVYRAGDVVINVET